MKLTDEQQRLLSVMGEYKGKAPMTAVNGLFHGNTITAMKRLKLIEAPLMGGWYLLTEAGKQVSTK